MDQQPTPTRTAQHQDELVPILRECGNDPKKILAHLQQGREDLVREIGATQEHLSRLHTGLANAEGAIRLAAAMVAAMPADPPPAPESPATDPAETPPAP